MRQTKIINARYSHRHKLLLSTQTFGSSIRAANAKNECEQEKINYENERVQIVNALAKLRRLLIE